MKKAKIKIPENWNQLNPRQLKKLAGLFNKSMPQKLFDWLVFTTLLNIRWWQLLKYRKALLILKATTFKELKKHYNWIYTEDNLTIFIPSIKGINQKLYAPMSRLVNISINEFAHTEDLFIGYNNTKDLTYLRYLAAVLYREKDTSGKRVPFEKTELDVRAKALKKVNKNSLYAIGLSYQGCRSYMYPKYPYVFPKPKADAPKQKVAPKSSNLGELILAVSGKKFGTHHETKTTNVYTFLAELNNENKPKPKKLKKHHA